MMVSMPTCLSCGATDMSGIPKDKQDGVLFLKPSPWLCPACQQAIAAAKRMLDPVVVCASGTEEWGKWTNKEVPH